MHSPLWSVTCSGTCVCAGAAAALAAAVAHITSQQAAGRDRPAAAHSTSQQAAGRDPIAAAHSGAEDKTADAASIRLPVEGSEMVEEEHSEQPGHALPRSLASCPSVAQ